MLSIIAQQTVYGYELSMKLAGYGLQVSEGSIYPILLRLQKEKLITGIMRKSPSGPNRKYYTLTRKGEEALKAFTDDWSDVKKAVEQILLREE